MQAFVNLPVPDLAESTAFFRALGFAFDPELTDENATRMIVDHETSVLLAVEPFFASFIEPQAIADTSKSREVLVGLSAESRVQVDELSEEALAAGAEAVARPSTRSSCTCVGSATSTATSGRSSTWTSPPFPGARPASYPPS